MDLKKNIIKNMGYLFLVQGSGFFIPIITLPYLVRTLGPEQYGILGLSISISQYLILFVQYGFDLSATQKIAAYRHNKKEISQVFWGVGVLKLIFIFISFIVLLLIINFVPILNSNYKVMTFSFLTVLGTAAMPSWFYQGMECMDKMALCNIVPKFLMLPLIFLFVNNESDAWIASLLSGLGFIISAALCYYLIYKSAWVKWCFPSFYTLKEIINDGKYIFISNLAGSAYINSIPIILAFTTNPVLVGYYVAADRIRTILQGIMNPITQVFYPRISSLIHSDRTSAVTLIKKLFIFQNIFFVLLTLFLILLSKPLILFLYGDGFHNSIIILQILAPIIIFVSVSTILGVQGMLILNMKKQFSQIIIFGAIFNTIIIFPLIYFFDVNGAALSVLLTEVIVALVIYNKSNFLLKNL